MGPHELARAARVIAVVGASPDPSRPSFGVMAFLLRQGVEVIPVRPGCESIMGLRCVSSLAEIGRPVDIVDVFRRSSAAAGVAAEAAAVGARALWLQQGVRSDEARRIAREAGMAYVEDLCIKTALLSNPSL